VKSARESIQETRREAAREFFENSIRHGRLLHAYILLGPEGSGKVAFSLELAKTLLCESGCKPGAAACAVCKQIESGNHPDVWLITPTSAGGRVLISDTREMRRQAYMARFSGRYRVFIVDRADRMSEAAQNQVLKVLEEPPPNTIILLLTAGLAGLLETVLSRCAVIRLGGVSPEAVRSEMSGRGDYTAGEIAWAARFSRGSYSRADRLLGAGAGEFNDLVAGAVLSDAADADMALADVLRGFSASGENTQERRVLAAEGFGVTAILLRDALAVKLDIDAPNLYNVNESGNTGAVTPAGSVCRLSRLFTAEDILDLLLIIADMQRRVGQNLNIDLLCDCLAQEVFSRRMNVTP
jgi:DNA polymerase-3 subunit delta'